MPPDTTGPSSELSPHPPAGSEHAAAGIDPAVLRLLVDAGREGRLVLFVGSDLPQPITGLPTGRDLAARLAERHGLSLPAGQDGLNDAAQLVGHAGEVLRFLRRELDTTGLASGRFDQLIARMQPLSLVITTRYDDLLDKALRQAGRPFDVLATDLQVSLRTPANLALLKLYGELQQPTTVTLSEDDLYRLAADKAALVALVEQAFTGSTVLFLGFDLSSPDFLLLWNNTLRRLSRFAPQAYAAAGGPQPDQVVTLWANRNIRLLQTSPLSLVEVLAAQLPALDAPAIAAAPTVTARRPEPAADPQPPVATYHNFDLELDRQGGRVIARVLRSREGEGEDLAETPAVPQSLDQLVSLLGLDEQIGQALLPGAVGKRWAANVATSEEQGDGLRLRLFIRDRSLAAVAWEAARVDGQRLALRVQTPVVRYIAAGRRPRKLAAARPLRLLVVLSASREIDLPPLDVDRERATVETAIDPLVTGSEPRLEMQILEGIVTKAALMDRLRTFRPHMLHFVGHGGYDETANRGFLILAQQPDAGPAQPDPLGAEELAVMLEAYGTQFVLLNACQTGRAAGGVAQALVAANLPAALGMQANVSDRAATLFAGEFYRALAAGWPVDAAVVEGRRRIAFELGFESPFWALPVLYMRAPDGVLWQTEP